MIPPCTHSFIMLLVQLYKLKIEKIYTKKEDIPKGISLYFFARFAGLFSFTLVGTEVARQREMVIARFAGLFSFTRWNSIARNLKKSYCPLCWAIFFYVSLTSWC